MQTSVCTAPACWVEVLVDVRGPITPADIDGYRYVFVWMCKLCRGAYLTALRHLQSSEIRRAVTTSVCRALTFPQLFGHDQGPELTNAVNEELVQLCGVTRRLGGAWRPWEQGGVEREHQEEARQLGVFLDGVFRCNPGEWAGLFVNLLDSRVHLQQGSVQGALTEDGVQRVRLRGIGWHLTLRPPRR